MKIFLVDDNPIFLAAAAACLSLHPQVEVVGMAHSALDAIDRLKRISAEWVFMDVEMPGLDGIAATVLIKGQPDAPRVMLVTSHTDLSHRILAANAGVDGFIAKDRFAESIQPLLNSRPHHPAPAPATAVVP